MLAQPEKVMTASQKKLKTQREQYHVMYQGKGRFEHSQFFVHSLNWQNKISRFIDKRKLQFLLYLIQQLILSMKKWEFTSHGCVGGCPASAEKGNKFLQFLTFVTRAIISKAII